jgi:hypothetical protein
LRAPAIGTRTAPRNLGTLAVRTRGHELPSKQSIKRVQSSGDVP